MQDYYEKRKEQKERDKLDREIYKSKKKHSKAGAKYDDLSQKAKKLEHSVNKAQIKYNKMQKSSALKCAANKETYLKLTRTRVLDKYGQVRYTTKARIALRDKKYSGAGVLHFALRRIDKLGGDVPSIERKLKNSVPKTKVGKAVKSTLLTGTKVMKKTWKTTLNAGLAAETSVLNGAKKAGRAASGAAKNKLREKANEAAEPFMVYLKASDYLSHKDIKQYVKQRKIYHIARAKKKLLKSEYKKAKNETKAAKAAYKQKNAAYRLKIAEVKSGDDGLQKYNALIKTRNEYKTAKRTKRYSLHNRTSRELIKSKRQVFHENKLDNKAFIKINTEAARLDKLEKKAEYRNKLSNSHGILAGKKREYVVQRRLAKYEKPKSLTAEKVQLLGKRYIQKVTNADDDNTTLVALGKAVEAGAAATMGTAGAYKLLNRTAINAEEKLRGAARKTSQNKLRKQTQKLQTQRKQISNPRYNPLRKEKKSFRQKTSEIIKGLGSAAVSAAGKLVVLCLPLALMLMLFVMILYLLSNSFTGMVNSAGVWTAGTYQTDDFSLSKAEADYTKRADGLNKDIVALSEALAGSSSSEWKSVLVNKFGASKQQLRKKPIEVYWGRSTRFDWDPVYDFDREKLWSFLCAYYAQIDPGTGVTSFSNWEYLDSTESLIDELFHLEYEFVYYYEERVTKWEELLNNDKSVYGYWEIWKKSGLNTSYAHFPERFISGPYMNMFPCVDSSIEYNVDRSAKWRYKFKILPINGQFDSPGNENVNASWLSNYADDDNYIYIGDFTSKYRVLNPHDEFRPTEYCLRDTLHYCFPKTSVNINGSYYKEEGYEPFYFSSSVKYPGKVGVYGNYFKDYDNYIISDRFSTPFVSSLPDSYVNFFIPQSDVQRFSNGEYNNAVFSFIEAYKPLEYYSKFYYNVKRNNTFDEVLRNKLLSEPNGAERIELYELFLGVANGSPNIHGGHQIFNTILPGTSFYEDYVETGKIATSFGYDMYKWNNITHVYQEGANDKLHNGIDIFVKSNTRIYAAFDGEIEKIDSSTKSMYLKSENFGYHYEKGATDSGGVNDAIGRDTSVRYYNVIPAGTIMEGSKVKAGDVIGYTTGDICCSGSDNTRYVADPYLHFEVYVDKDGIGWDYVDPIPLLGNKYTIGRIY